MKVKTLYEPIFGVDVTFATECSSSELEKWLKKKRRTSFAEDSNYDSLAGSVTFLDEVDKKGRKTREYLVVVEGKKDFYTLLHECHHLATHIMIDRMIPVNENNDEVAAYLQTYWFKQLWRFMNNRKVVYKTKR